MADRYFRATTKGVAPRTGLQLDQNTVGDAESALREFSDHDLRIREMLVPTDPCRNRPDWNAVSVG